MDRHSLIVTANGWARRVSYSTGIRAWLVTCLRCRESWVLSDPNEVQSCPCHASVSAA